MRTPSILSILALSSLILNVHPVQAHLIQLDGGSPGDASGTCLGNVPELILGHATFGHLEPPEDVADSYLLHVKEEDANRAHLVLLVGLPPDSFQVVVLAPHGPDGPRCQRVLASAPAGEPLSYVPATAGEHVVQVVYVGDQSSLAVDLPPRPLSGVTFCHNMCDPVMGMLGYSIWADVP